MITICPRCQQRVHTASSCSDVVHVCNSSTAALDQEDIVVKGNWSDYTGSGTAHKHQVMLQGVQDELQGTEGGVRGAKFGGVTDRGNRKFTHRQRQHLEYIKLKN